MTARGNWALTVDLAEAFLAEATAQGTTATAVLETLLSDYTALSSRQRRRFLTDISQTHPAEKAPRGVTRNYWLPLELLARFEAVCNAELRVSTMVVESLMCHYLHAPRKPQFNPKLRDKNPDAEVVAAFNAACAEELRAPGLVVEAFMIAYTQMKQSDRLDLPLVRAAYYKKRKKPRPDQK